MINMIEETLTWTSSRPLWIDCGSWQPTVRRVLERAARGLSRPDSPLLLPFLCAQATDADPTSAIPAASAWTLLYLAAHLLDTVEDQEYNPEAWQGIDQAQILNVASAFLAAIPLVLEALEDATSRSALKPRFQRGALTMAAGQHADLSGWAEPGPEAMERIWQIIEAKSSALFALGCRAGAQLGHPTEERLEAYAAFGHAFGSIIQLCDDYTDTYESAPPSVYWNEMPLPLAYAYTVADAPQRARLQTLQGEASGDDQAAIELKQLLDRLGARLYMSLQIERLREEARKALEKAAAPDPLAQRLLSLIPSHDDA